MSYVGGRAKEEGCIFCNRLHSDHDIESLILHRWERSFVIMNLFPYNTGHIMLVPNEHASDPSDVAPETLAEMGTVLPILTTALRSAFGCHGFNVGLNIGAIAGAGVEAHLHQHIVPRWQGDANFMPIIASTMTIPELIPVTYAKIRAELIREISGANSVRYVVLDPSKEQVLLNEGSIPSASLGPQTPIIDAIARSLPEGIEPPQLAGWAGPDGAHDASADDIVLTLIGSTEHPPPEPWTFASIPSIIDESSRHIVTRAIRQLAPAR